MVHYLTESDGYVYFALLTDWTYSEREREPNDEALLQAALDGITALNQRHGGLEAKPRFLILHRSRMWNASEGRWMGWERKRGKLHELNRLLRGADNTSYSVMCGRLPEKVRYVLTLEQHYQMLEGGAVAGGRTLALEEGRLTGDSVAFTLTDASGGPSATALACNAIAVPPLLFSCQSATSIVATSDSRPPDPVRA